MSKNAHKLVRAFRMKQKRLTYVVVQHQQIDQQILLLMLKDHEITLITFFFIQKNN